MGERLRWLEGDCDEIGCFRRKILNEALLQSVSVDGGLSHFVLKSGWVSIKRSWRKADDELCGCLKFSVSLIIALYIVYLAPSPAVVQPRGFPGAPSWMQGSCTLHQPTPPPPPQAARSWETVNQRRIQGFVRLVVSVAPLSMRCWNVLSCCWKRQKQTWLGRCGGSAGAKSMPQPQPSRTTREWHPLGKESLGEAFCL